MSIAAMRKMTIADSSVLYDGNSLEASEPVVTVDGGAYNPEAAANAWDQSLVFLKRYL